MRSVDDRCQNVMPRKDRSVEHNVDATNVLTQRRRIGHVTSNQLDAETTQFGPFFRSTNESPDFVT